VTEQDPSQEPRAEDAPAAGADAPETPSAAAADAPEAPSAPGGHAPETPSAPPAARTDDAEILAGDLEIIDGDDEGGDEAPRARPEIPGADLEVDIVEEGADPLAERDGDEEGGAEGADEDALEQPIATAAIDLAAGARYRATGKRKTAVARVILRPGSGVYTINGKVLDAYFPRPTLQRGIRQPLETVGYEERMDVVARLHGGGVSAQAGALRHGISRALLEADPNLRGELKRRGFLTRDARAKERKKAGLKKARKRPQFSKR
jgi:small subunit ribosomal protein S9